MSESPRAVETAEGPGAEEQENKFISCSHSDDVLHTVHEEAVEDSIGKETPVAEKDVRTSTIKPQRRERSLSVSFMRQELSRALVEDSSKEDQEGAKKKLTAQQKRLLKELREKIHEVNEGSVYQLPPTDGGMVRIERELRKGEDQRDSLAASSLKRPDAIHQSRGTSFFEASPVTQSASSAEHDSDSKEHNQERERGATLSPETLRTFSKSASSSEEAMPPKRIRAETRNSSNGSHKVTETPVKTRSVTVSGLKRSSALKPNTPSPKTSKAPSTGKSSASPEVRTPRVTTVTLTPKSASPAFRKGSSPNLPSDKKGRQKVAPLSSPSPPPVKADCGEGPSFPQPDRELRARRQTVAATPSQYSTGKDVERGATLRDLRASDKQKLQNLAAARKECSALEDDKERIEHRLHTLQEQSKELQFKHSTTLKIVLNYQTRLKLIARNFNDAQRLSDDKDIIIAQLKARVEELQTAKENGTGEAKEGAEEERKQDESRPAVHIPADREGGETADSPLPRKKIDWTPESPSESRVMKDALAALDDEKSAGRPMTSTKSERRDDDITSAATESFACRSSQKSQQEIAQSDGSDGEDHISVASEEYHFNLMKGTPRTGRIRRLLSIQGLGSADKPSRANAENEAGEEPVRSHPVRQALEYLHLEEEGIGEEDRKIEPRGPRVEQRSLSDEGEQEAIDEEEETGEALVSPKEADEDEEQETRRSGLEDMVNTISWNTAEEPDAWESLAAAVSRDKSRVNKETREARLASRVRREKRSETRIRSKEPKDDYEPDLLDLVDDIELNLQSQSRQFGHDEGRPALDRSTRRVDSQPSLVEEADLVELLREIEDDSQ